MGYKSRFNYTEHRLDLYVHYEPNHLASYATDIASIRLAIAISVIRSICLRHANLKEKFVHENYTSPWPLFMKPIPSFDGLIKKKYIRDSTQT